MILVADNVVNHFQFLILIDFSSSGTIFYHFHQKIPFFLEAAFPASKISFYPLTRQSEKHEKNSNNLLFFLLERGI